MSITLARVGNPTSFGDKKVGFFDVTLPTSYTTGGEALTVAASGLALSIHLVLVSQRNGIIIEPLYQTDGSVLLKCVYPTGGASAPATATAPVNVAPTATLANAAVPAGATPVTSSGAQPALTMTQPTISAPAQTAGIGKEVASTTNLSALGVVRIAVFGA
jgi:hypothetical protein